MPERAHRADAGADLRTPVPVGVYPGKHQNINTGVHIEIPYGFVGLLKAKSGLNTKAHLVCTGVIDSGYSGPIVVPVKNHGKKPYFFNAGDKVAQLLIMPVSCCEFVQADYIEGGERGDDGFGSTGA